MEELKVPGIDGISKQDHLVYRIGHDGRPLFVLACLRDIAQKLRENVVPLREAAEVAG